MCVIGQYISRIRNLIINGMFVGLTGSCFKFMAFRPRFGLHFLPFPRLDDPRTHKNHFRCISRSWEFASNFIEKTKVSQEFKYSRVYRNKMVARQRAMVTVWADWFCAIISADYLNWHEFFLSIKPGTYRRKTLETLEENQWNLWEWFFKKPWRNKGRGAFGGTVTKKEQRNPNRFFLLHG